jgi:hypothetical protein
LIAGMQRSYRPAARAALREVPFRWLALEEDL